MVSTRIRQRRRLSAITAICGATALAISVGSWTATAATTSKVTWRTAIPSTATAAFDPSTAQCADLLFIGARGSDETDANPDNRTFGATVQRVRDGLKDRIAPKGQDITVRQVYVDYIAPAVDIILGDLGSSSVDSNGLTQSAYFGAESEGATNAGMVLEGSLRNCPGEKWIVSGYSQGAMVADDLAFFYHYPSRWAGSFTVADPYSDPARATNYLGSASNGKKEPTGILTHFTSSQGSFDDLKPGSFSYCVSDDVMCNYSAKNVAIATLTNFGPHGSYKTSNQLKDATQKLANHVNSLNFGTGSANPVPAPTFTSAG